MASEPISSFSTGSSKSSIEDFQTFVSFVFIEMINGFDDIPKVGSQLYTLILSIDAGAEMKQVEPEASHEFGSWHPPWFALPKPQ